MSYNAQNYTDSAFTLDANNPDQCNYKYNEQLIVLYIQNLGFFPVNESAKFIYSQQNPNIQPSYSLNIDLSSLFTLTNKDISFDTDILATIYYFSQRL